MTIYLHWWYLPILLAVLPFVYIWRRGPGTAFDLEVDIFAVWAGCWLTAAGIMLGHYL